MAINPAFITGGLQLLGGILGGKSRQREVARQNELEMQKFVRLRQAAEAGGFHPLEALRSGAEVQATARPGIMSSIAASGAFDTLENELTGEGARQRRRAQVDDEIRERELERLKLETARGIIGTATVGGNRPPKLPAQKVGGGSNNGWSNNGASNNGLANDENDEYLQRKENPQGEVKTEHGAPVVSYEGPDPGEAFMGFINAKRSDARAETAHRAQINPAPQRPEPIPLAIQQQMAAGRKNPGDYIRYKGKTWILRADGTMIDSAQETRPKGGAFSG